jgi:hypothetical protein
MAIVQNIDLNLIPDSEAVVVKVNQYDDGTGRIKAHLYLNDTAYTPASGATVRIEGTKPDKHGFSYTASISGNTVTADLTTQMTAVAGRTRAQIIVEEPSGKTGTFAFWLDVQAAALADDTDISDTELPAIMDLARQNAAIASAAAESASDSAAAAASSAQGVQGYAEDAEAYAVGKRGGTDVPSSDVAYHNNSKYYAQQAGSSAQSAAESAAAAEVWTAHPPYIGANGNWYIYNTTTETFVDSGIDASITVQIADITMLDSSATPYVTNTGSNTDPIFHLFLPRGQQGLPGTDGTDGTDGDDGVGIASIAKTGSQTVSGRVVDTYTITYTDNTTTTYQVVNGKDGADGQGSGDMRKEIYDPLNNQYPLNIMTGATASSAGTVGFPPPPGIGDQGKFFKGDGTWADTGSGDVSQSEIAPVEATSTASKAYAVGDLFIYDGKLYRVIAAISSGGTITPGTNVAETSVSEVFVRKTGDEMSGMLTTPKLTVGSRASGYGAGRYSIAAGTNAVASSDYSYGFGNKVKAINNNSFATGDTTTASGSASFATGSGVTASGNYSHAEGNHTEASDQSAHAEGNYSTASGFISHAEGQHVTASGYYSHAEGYYTIAGYETQHVQGKYNDNKSTSAFEIGNGTADNARSNALEVTWDGDVIASGDITDGHGNVLSEVDNRVATMPTAGADYVGDIVQYVGTTTASYTNGYFYKCVEDSSTNPSTYSWEQANVQPLGNDDIFVAEFNVTTYAAVNAAYTAGKYIIATRSYNGASLFTLASKANDGTFFFTGFTNTQNTLYQCTLASDDSWNFDYRVNAGTASPSFTGTPTAPTATAGTNNTQIATTAFVNTAIGAAPNMPDYSATKVTGTVDDDTLEFTNAAITATCVIDGPYIEDVLIGIDSVTQSGTTVTYTLEDDSADGASAYIWVRTLNA